MLSMPAVRDRIATHGTAAMISTPGQFGAMIKSEMPLYQKVIQATNIRID